MSDKILPIESTSLIEICDPEPSTEEDSRDFDSFFLQHLRSIKANDAWYINHHFIGKGGNGTTFYVTCTSGPNTGTQFALKVFHKISDKKRRDRFLHEVKHYKDLSHPSIIKIHDEGTFEAKSGKPARKYPFAIIDYMPTTLATIIARQPRITRLEAIRYGLNVASGIAYLHSQKNPIVHRDIKPENILVSGHNARLGDLGLARVLMGREEQEDGKEVAAYIAMPRFYRTPELVQIANGEKVGLTPASDIYQFGLVLYKLLTGYNPQRQPNKVTDNIELDVRPLRGVSADALGSLFSAMLESDPSKRPTALDVLNKLSGIHKDVSKADLEATGIMR